MDVLVCAFFGKKDSLTIGRDELCLPVALSPCVFYTLGLQILAMEGGREKMREGALWEVSDCTKECFAVPVLW